MRKALFALVLVMGLIVGQGAQASAASTRAEYIAQVDPICQAFVGPLGDAFSAYQKNFKAANRAAKSGTFKQFLRTTKKTAVSLNVIAGTRTSMIDQIAPVPPVAGDAATISAWLGFLRQESGFESSAASALLRLKTGKFFHNLGQADNAQESGTSAVAGFGFHVCGAPPIV
jgi:hypothetical protein